ncbi:MAG TPA: nickel pincer cofactor biosynthesis protein LarB [Actinomycetota bacterium]|nr:nickel pincer cofactor biosynthesis protein LarB [Actinomycetota bacterium]
MDERTLSRILSGVASGAVPVESALRDLRDLPFQQVPDAMVDHHRELRTGQAEAVYAPGKTPRQVRDTAAALAARASGAVFATKATPEQFHAVLEAVPTATYSPRSRLIVVKRAGPEIAPGRLAVISAGTSDLPVAEEAAQTGEALGAIVDRISDVGVAGLHRILAARERIDAADVVVVAAGMEGALPSVVAGLTPRPVVAVPTSIGYGAAFEGLAALLSMLSACAPGICVVNIDNGFGAALVAHRILRPAPGSGPA